MRQVVIASVSVLLSLLLTPASADVVERQDPRDNGRFDLRGATHGHEVPANDGARRLVHRIWTQGEWSRRDIRCRLDGCPDWSLWMEFDTKGGPDHERVLHIFSQRGRGMEAEMFRHTDGNEGCEGPRIMCGRNGYLGRVGVWRDDRSTVVVRIKKRLLGWQLKSYGWRVISTYDDPEGGCSQTSGNPTSEGGYAITRTPVPPFCVDYLPGRRTYVGHREL